MVLPLFTHHVIHLKTQELAFAVEAVYGVAPFGVHQFWTKVGPGVEGEGQDEQALEKLLESCPEALAILPPEVVRVSPAWREAVCGFEGDDVVRVSEAWTGEDVCDWDGRWGGDEGGDKRTK